MQSNLKPKPTKWGFEFCGLSVGLHYFCQITSLHLASRWNFFVIFSIKSKKLTDVYTDRNFTVTAEETLYFKIQIKPL